MSLNASTIAYDFSTYRPFLAVLDGVRSAMVEQTLKWSAINSGSNNQVGLDQMIEAVLTDFSHLGDEVARIALPDVSRLSQDGQSLAVNTSDAVVIRHAPWLQKRVLMSIHLDTVFERDHAFQTAWIADENTLRGPGVADAKGGLCVIANALSAFRNSPFADKLGIDVVLVPDEETGSLGSAEFLKSFAIKAGIGLVYEPSISDLELAGARKGSGNFSLVIKGRSAHAGRNLTDGRNAIIAAAKAAVWLDELNQKQTLYSLNVARIDGGGPTNVVPDNAVVCVNIRTSDHEAQHHAGRDLQEIADLINQMEGMVAQWHGGFHRPARPMDEAHLALFKFVADCGAGLGLSIGHKPTGGCCDGNNLSSYGLPTIDTLGVRGGAIHTDQEFALIDSFVERAKLSALILMRLANEDGLWPKALGVK